jgi:hypothetical protein
VKVELSKAARDLHEKLIKILRNENLKGASKDFLGRLLRELSSGTFYFNPLSELALHVYNLDISMLVSENAKLVRNNASFENDYKSIILAAQRAKGGVTRFIDDFCSNFIIKFCNL